MEDKNIEIPIEVAKEIANKYNYDQVVILGLKESKKKLNWFEGWATTFNKDKKKCGFLGKVAAILHYNLRAYYSNEKAALEHYEYLQISKEK